MEEKNIYNGSYKYTILQKKAIVIVRNDLAILPNLNVCEIGL